MSEVLEKYLNDKSLYGKLHSIYYYGLVLRSSVKSESELYKLLDIIQDRGYRAVSLINSHPSILGKMIHDQDLQGYISQIEEALSSILFLGYNPPEIKEIKKILKEVKATVFTSTTAIA